MANLNIFQKYSQKENAVTNNVLLLFSLLFENNPIIYNQFFNQLFDDENSYDVTPSFSQQVGKGGKGTIDGFIHTPSSKIVIETKKHTLEEIDKLLKYLDRFDNEDKMVLIHLSNQVYSSTQIEEIENRIKEVPNAKGAKFFSLTFESIAIALEALVNLYPYEKQLEFLSTSFKNYCETEKLISRKKYLLRAVTCGKSKVLNRKYNFYFDPLNRSFQPHKYLGIYYEKSVHLIGEIKVVVHAEMIDGKLVIQDTLQGKPSDLTPELKANLERGMREYLEDGWDIATGIKFFICKEMFETDFKKITKYGIFSSRYFDLRDYLEKEELPKISELAEELKMKSWE